MHITGKTSVTDSEMAFHGSFPVHCGWSTNSRTTNIWFKPIEGRMMINMQSEE